APAWPIPCIAASVFWSVAANPHAPWSMTRKPMPRSDDRLTDSTSPSRIETISFSRSTWRASAHVEARATAICTRSGRTSGIAVAREYREVRNLLDDQPALHAGLVMALHEASELVLALLGRHHASERQRPVAGDAHALAHRRFAGVRVRRPDPIDGLRDPVHRVAGGGAALQAGHEVVLDHSGVDELERHLLPCVHGDRGRREREFR